jgi:ArsR family transcriptional regulator
MEFYDLQAEICRCLADPKRLMIISALRDGEKSVGQLVVSLGLKQANVSQHLSVLRAKNLVTTRRRGATIYYALRSSKISQACDLVHEFLEESLENHRAIVSANRKAHVTEAENNVCSKRN